MNLRKYPEDPDIPVMTRQQVRAVDEWAIKRIGFPGAVLMENAGRSCAELVQTVLVEKRRPAVCVVCGKGNNGGDGFVIARHLYNAGFDVRVAVTGNTDKISGDAAINLKIWQNMDKDVSELDIDSGRAAGQLKELAKGCDMLIDAIFGTGLQGQLKPTYKELIDQVNTFGMDVLAVDIPSGLDCDTGKPLGTAIHAKYTVSFVAVKKGFTAEESRPYTGKIYTASIGVEPKVISLWQ